MYNYIGILHSELAYVIVYFVYRVAYAEGKKERPPFLPELEKKPLLLKKPVPKELKCPLCGDLAKDAVVIPCCGISYCDECKLYRLYAI